jgi:hypothetical protein
MPSFHHNPDLVPYLQRFPALSLLFQRLPFPELESQAD